MNLTSTLAAPAAAVTLQRRDDPPRRQFFWLSLFENQLRVYASDPSSDGAYFCGMYDRHGDASKRRTIQKRIIWQLTTAGWLEWKPLANPGLYRRELVLTAEGLALVRARKGGAA